MQKKFMDKALEAARKSGKDLPVGAVIVKNNEVLAQACNAKEKLNDPTAHAEILAIREAAKKLNNWRLDDCEIYVTLEPCPMCAFALSQCRIKTVYFGAYDSLYGACSSVYNFDIHAKGGIMEKEAAKLLRAYFQNIRKVQNKQHERIS